MGRLLFLVLAVVVVLLCGCVARKPPVEPDFSQYPKSVLEMHTVTPKRQPELLMMMSSFESGDKVASICQVSVPGKVYSVCEVYDWARRFEHTAQLSSDELNRLRAALKELPADSESPPLERLVIVSFRDGTKWVTRSYDFTKPSEALASIWKTLRGDARELL